MAVTITPENYVIGPASVYYREIGVVTPWTSIGATLDDAVMRINTEWFRPDNINGPLGFVQGLDILRRVYAEVEFTMPEMAGPKLALVVPGSGTTTATGDVKTSGHLDTDIDGAVTAGATTITVTSALNGAAGDAIKIGTGATAEYREITLVSTNDLSFRDPLIFDHADAEVVEEADDDYRSYITPPTKRRLTDTDYKEWALVAESGKAQPHELRILRGVSQTENAEVPVADDAVSGIRVTIGARYLGSSLATAPWRLFYPQGWAVPERTEDAALRGILHITIGGEPVELRTLTLDESDDWLDELATHLSDIELPDDSGRAAIKGALTMPAKSARDLVIAYDKDGRVEDWSRASKRELKDAFEQMVSAEDPFGEGVSRSVAEAYGAPARIMGSMLEWVLSQSLPAALTTGPSSDTGPTTGPSDAHGAESSSSSDGPMPSERTTSE